MLMSSKFLPVTCFVCPEYSYWECKYWQPPSRPYYWGPNWLVWNPGTFCVFTFDPESSFYFSIWALPHLSLAGCWNQQVNLHSCFYVSLHQNIAIMRRETFVEALGVLDINHLTDKNQEILGLCWLQRWSGLLLKKVIPQNDIISGPLAESKFQKAISLNPGSFALQINWYYHAPRKQQQELFLLQPIAQFRRSDVTTVSPVISGLTCVCLGTMSLAFGFCYFSMGLACRNQRSIFLTISEVRTDEVFWTGGDWTQWEAIHASPTYIQ